MILLCANFILSFNCQGMWFFWIETFYNINNSFTNIHEIISINIKHALNPLRCISALVPKHGEIHFLSTPIKLVGPETCSRQFFFISYLGHYLLWDKKRGEIAKITCLQCVAIGGARQTSRVVDIVYWTPGHQE